VTYSPPDWPGFFDKVETFLDDLPRLNRRAA
jgi:hypothetical protein